MTLDSTDSLMPTLPPAVPQRSIDWGSSRSACTWRKGGGVLSTKCMMRSVLLGFSLDELGTHSPWNPLVEGREETGHPSGNMLHFQMLRGKRCLEKYGLYRATTS